MGFMAYWFAENNKLVIWIKNSWTTVKWVPGPRSRVENKQKATYCSCDQRIICIYVDIM